MDGASTRCACRANSAATAPFTSRWSISCACTSVGYPRCRATAASGRASSVFACTTAGRCWSTQWRKRRRYSGKLERRFRGPGVARSDLQLYRMSRCAPNTGKPALRTASWVSPGYGAQNPRSHPRASSKGPTRRSARVAPPSCSSWSAIRTRPGWLLSPARWRVLSARSSTRGRAESVGCGDESWLGDGSDPRGPLEHR